MPGHSLEARRYRRKGFSVTLHKCDLIFLALFFLLLLNEECLRRLVCLWVVMVVVVVVVVVWK